MGQILWGCFFCNLPFLKSIGAYRFALKSDDGSKLFIDAGSNGKRDKRQPLVNNDGLHGMKNVEGTIRLRRSYLLLVLEFFEKTGGAGMSFRLAAKLLELR